MPMRIHIFDVEHGACAAIETPTGHLLMIDCGHKSYCQIWCSGAESSGGLIDVCYFDSVFEFHAGDHLREISESA